LSRALIIDDESRSAKYLAGGLASHGYQSSVVHDAATAFRLVQTRHYDVIIFDIELDGLGGVDGLKRFRAGQPDAAILAVTPSQRTDLVTAVLDASADDVVSRPVSFDELVARIRARTRSTRNDSISVLTAGEIQLDLRSRRALSNGNSIDLTAREFAMAETFFRHPDQVLSPEQLLNHVWGYDYSPDSNLVAVYVRTLRRKLGARAIQTVRGMGYRLRVC